MTEGILGSSVIMSSQALVMAEASSSFDRSVIQGMSSKIMTLANETLSALLSSNYGLKSITIQETDHFIYVRPINEKFHVVVITNTEETPGLREMNIKELIKRLQDILKDK